MLFTGLVSLQNVSVLVGLAKDFANVVIRRPPFKENSYF